MRINCLINILVFPFRGAIAAVKQSEPVIRELVGRSWAGMRHRRVSDVYNAWNRCLEANLSSEKTNRYAVKNALFSSTLLLAKDEDYDFEQCYQIVLKFSWFDYVLPNRNLCLFFPYYIVMLTSQLVIFRVTHFYFFLFFSLK